MKRKEKRKIARISLPVFMTSEVTRIQAAIPEIGCQRKCQESCSPVGHLMTDFERDRIVARTGRRPNVMTPLMVVDQSKRETCNLLSSDGSCSVHDIRPTICRLWGVDSAMACPFGCEGSGCLPHIEGRKCLRGVQNCTESYRSPL